jgi:hypothetical protein
MRKVVAVIPVHGRLQLLKYTIRRLYQRNGIYKVICVGNTPEEKELCLSEKALWYDHPNILGAKWNLGFRMARKLNPDAVLFVGSSDWICDSWIDQMYPHLRKSGMVGKAGYHTAHLLKDNSVILGEWMGYRDERSIEPIGIGRLLSKKALIAIKWKPFLSKETKGMDYQMFNKLRENGQRCTIVNNSAHCISVSTELWNNLHEYDDSSTGDYVPVEDPNPFLMKHYPEIFKIFS